MTREKAKALLRNAKMAAVIGAMIFLANGVSSLEAPREYAQESATHMDIGTRTREPNQMPPAEETAAPADESKPDTECNPATYGRRNLGHEDGELLCRIAMAEAGNQDTEGKALVMLVVLNRVRGDNEFPDTIEEVLYQQGQFSPVMNGTFENTVPSGDCREALRLVESGWDESQGALYFESRSDSTWHSDNLKFLFKHGDHYFYTERD